LLKKNKIKLGVVTKSHVELNQLAMKAQMELISIRKRELLWQRVTRNLTKKKPPTQKKKKKKKKGGASENIHGGVVWRFFIVIWTTWLDF
jgi:hypothetical protein